MLTGWGLRIPEGLGTLHSEDRGPRLRPRAWKKRDRNEESMRAAIDPGRSKHGEHYVLHAGHDLLLEAPRFQGCRDGRK